METFITIFDSIFGCHHRRLSRVFTVGGRTYRVLLQLRSEVQIFARDYVHGAALSISTPRGARTLGRNMPYYERRSGRGFRGVDTGMVKLAETVDSVGRCLSRWFLRNLVIIQQSVMVFGRTA